ncbi:FlgD immunoglobulin-like domain containing protein [Streptomyces sp. NPDC020412]|uniref:FlgD immunoglobulin-like domain containing protein n=1 Tax=Streptomyces sp. NPDC020412 TaxID=3365073 RepID=UPI003788DC92
MATAVAVAAGAGLCTAVTAPSAVAAEPKRASAASDAVVPPQARYLPREDTLLEAGATGYLHKREGHKGRYWWTEYATGETREAPALAEQYGHSGLRAEESSQPDGSGSIVITDLGSGSTNTIGVPEGASFTTVYTADSIVVHRFAADGNVASMSILRRAADGTITERAVTGVPDGVDWWVSVDPAQQDGRGAVIGFQRVDPAAPMMFLLDYETARLTPLPKPGDGSLSERHVVVDYDLWEYKVVTLDRRDPTAAPVTTTIPKPTGPERPYGGFAVVGDWLLISRDVEKSGSKKYVPGGGLYAIPIGGSQQHQLLRYSDMKLVTAPDGSVLVVGGSGAADWAVRRVTVGADGKPQLTKVRDVPFVPAQLQGLALGGGVLSYAAHTDAAPLPSLYDHDVSFAGAPAVGERRLRHTQPSTFHYGVHALGDGRTGFSSSVGMYVANTDKSLSVVRVPGSGVPEVMETTGRYSLIRSYGYGQYIGDVRRNSDDNVLMPWDGAASLWGGQVWKPGHTVGTIAQYDFATQRTTRDFHLDSGCTPDKLQAVGRWVYWSCGSGAAAKAGVWDHKVRKSIPVPTNGSARLGDGFVVREADGKLLLTDFHRGAGGAVATREFAAVPAGAKWAVDKFGGDVAFTDAEGAIRIRPVNVPRSPIAVVEGVADPNNAGDGAWNARWQLSRPPASWTVTVKDSAGKVVRTLTSTDRSGAQIEAAWDTKDAAGKQAPAGAYTWTLTATPADSPTPTVLRTGKVTVSPTSVR